MILGPAATASPGSWLELQIPGLHPRLTDSSVWGLGICFSEPSMGVLLHSQVEEPLHDSLLSLQRRRVSVRLCWMRGTQRSQVIVFSNSDESLSCPLM